MELGKRISILRKDKGITQKELANALCVTDKAISRWESGLGNPDIEIIPKIAEFFGVTIDYLFDGEETINTSEENNNKTRKINKKTIGLVSVCFAIIIGTLSGILIADRRGSKEIAKGNYDKASKIYCSWIFKNKNRYANGLREISLSKEHNDYFLLEDGVSLILDSKHKINVHYDGNGQVINSNNELQFDETLDEKNQKLYVPSFNTFINWKTLAIYSVNNEAYLYLIANII